MNDATAQTDASSLLPLAAAADLQDHLMTASNDLDRLQTLLADACETLMLRFSGATEQVRSRRCVWWMSWEAMSWNCSAVTAAPSCSIRPS